MSIQLYSLATMILSFGSAVTSTNPLSVSAGSAMLRGMKDSPPESHTPPPLPASLREDEEDEVLQVVCICVSTAAETA